MKYKTKTLLQSRRIKFSNEVNIDKRNLYLSKVEKSETKKDYVCSSR